jgi:hypothetical protein
MHLNTFLVYTLLCAVRQASEWIENSLSNIYLYLLLKESAEMYRQRCCVMCVATSLMLLTVLCYPDGVYLLISLVQ